MDRLPFLHRDMLDQLENIDEEPQLWEVPPVKLAPLGRVLNNLLSADSKDLQKALKQISSKSQRGALAKAASALLEHVKVLIHSDNSLEPVTVPLLEQIVKSKDHISRKPGFCLLCLLLENEEVGWATATQLSLLIRRDGTDNRVRLGWCLVVRELIQSGSIRCKAEQSLDEFGYESDVVLLFAACIPQLLHVVCHASVRDGKRRAPTRLTTAAADCTLVITKALATGPGSLENVSQRSPEPKESEKSLITVVDSDGSNRSTNVECIGDDGQPSFSGRQEARERLLWDQLDNLILLVAELHEWNVVSRPLHTAGLQQVQKRLQALANFRDSLQAQGEGEADLKIGVSVLAACWHRYSSFMMFENHDLARHPEAVLQQSMGALQYYSEEEMTGDHDEESMSQDRSRRAAEMRKYALACLALVLGRLGPRQLDSVLEEIEPELLKLLLNQLRCGDVQAVDLSVAILRDVLFRSVPAKPSTDSSSLSISRLEALIPSLMELLDERDSAARAVVLLVSEFFAVNPKSPEFEHLFKRLDSPESVRRRNALDVLGELLSITTRAADVADSALSQTLAGHLLSRLGDEELTNRVEASALFAKLDPGFVLPALVNSVFSADGRVRSSASSAILSLLKSHSDYSLAVCMLLDCITKLSESTSLPIASGKSEVGDFGVAANSARSRVDMDRIMNLVPTWAMTVEDWEPLTRTLLKKMVAEPSNPVLPRFLSQISAFIVDKAHIIFSHVLSILSHQRILGSDILTHAGEAKSWEADGGALAKELFQRLNPLLVLKVLPLEMFNDKKDKYLYGNVLQGMPSGADGIRSDDELPEQGSCIASLLVQRMSTPYEFQEVRKLAAELTGRLVPEIMLPQVLIQLEAATSARNLLRVKAGIYALCNAFVIRGKQLLFHEEIPIICSFLTSVLLWPSSDEGIVKAQHGCIDCFAVMILAEVTPPKQPSDTGNHGRQSNLQEVNKMGTPLEEVPEANLEGLSNRRKLDDEVGFRPELLDEVPPMFKLVDTSNDRPKLIEEVVRPPKLIDEVVEKQLVERSESERSTDDLDGLTRICGTVISCLTGQLKHVPFTVAGTQCLRSSSKPALSTQLKADSAQRSLGSEGPLSAPTPFRLCMANALISACQKVPINSRVALAEVIVPPVMLYVKDGTEAPIIAACLQVLFSAVYHLKAQAVLPFCTDMLSLAITLIRGSGPSEVRVGAVKVLTALLASDEAIINELASHLMDAQSVLQSVARMDRSLEMRNLCEQLLGCLTAPPGMSR